MCSLVISGPIPKHSKHLFSHAALLDSRKYVVLCIVYWFGGDGLEEGWDANRFVLNAESHNAYDAFYFTRGINVNYDSSGMGYGSEVTEQLCN